jgi:DNA-binding LacI/PurR family transcriptional regulator
MRKVTIEDISRKTGLSRGTVSRALNDRPDISARTKQAVLEACQALNYRPSHAARSLATGRSYAVAVLVDDVRSALAASFLRGVIARAHQARYAVHVVETGDDPGPDRVAAFSPDRIDGVLNAVLLAPNLANDLWRATENRVLASCWPLEGVGCDVLMPDHTEAGRLAARFLFRHESSEPLYVHRSATFGAADRLAGFQEVLREHDVDPASVTITAADLDDLGEIEPRLKRADVVIASDDFLAVAVMLACVGLGRRPGDDVAVIGYGNERVASAIRPTLTSIDFDCEEIGRRLMDAVLQRLGQKRMDTPQMASVAPRLVERESTRQLVSSR